MLGSSLSYLDNSSRIRRAAGHGRKKSFTAPYADVAVTRAKPQPIESGEKKMRRIELLIALACGCGVLIGIRPAMTQALPPSLLEGGTEAAVKERKNNWTVGLAGGLFEGTFMRLAADMGRALDDGDNLRVMPIVSRGAASNLEDLLYVRGVDVAVTQSDVFEFFRNQRNTPNLATRVNYILRFPLSETHLVARAEIHSIEELRGRKVHFGAAGAAGSLTGPIIFQRLGIDVQQVDADNPTAMKMLNAGQIDAIVRVVGKPVEYVTSIPPNSGLHLLQIPYSQKFADFYTLGEFTSADYPALIPPGGVIETIAVPGVLAVYNWPKGSDRERRVQRFIERLFGNWAKLQQPPYHPKWRDINLAATVPGWTRYRVAEDMLQILKKQDAAADLKHDFEKFVQARPGPDGAPPSPTQSDAMFREFMQWKARSAPSPAR
jgi:TRAP-type uncharacterized transport system substrate-binding protein